MIKRPASGGVALGLLLAFQGGACNPASERPRPPENPAPPPAPRVPVETGEPIPITGTERLGWVQLVFEGSDISRHEFFLYIDAQRTALTQVSCESAGLYHECSSPLPPMEPGRHRLQLQAAHTVGRTRVESRRSGIILVMKTGNAASATAAARSGEAAGSGSGIAAASSDGVEVLTDRVGAIADLAIAPDGQLFALERSGRVLAVRDGQLDPRPALEVDDAVTAHGLGVFSIAIHPEFATNRLVYLIYAAESPDGPLFRIARGREAGGTIGEVATIAHAGPVAAAGWAVLRFGPDGKLYAALRRGAVKDANARNANEGHILRFNADGTTPADNPGSSPVVSSGHAGLSGLTFASIGPLIARASKAGQVEILWYNDPASLVTGRNAAATLPLDGRAGGIAYESRSASGLPNRLLLARLDGGIDLLAARARGEAQGRRVRVAEQYGAVRAVAVAADGTIYAGTANADFRRTVSGAGDYLLRIRALQPAP